MTHPVTGKDNDMELDVTNEQLQAWETGTLIQEAMPNLTADEREFLITGLLPGEFERMFAKGKPA
tara:strand:- start:12 stop:206 length:195 start_codon:yes stop_codon:yes gene_type:complete